MIGKRWVIWKLSSYGSGIQGPDTDHDPDAKGLEAVRSAEVEVMAVADLYSDKAREVVAKALAGNALGLDPDPSHVSMFDEDAEKLLKALRDGLAGGE